jgi:hypothetical protein
LFSFPVRFDLLGAQPAAVVWLAKINQFAGAQWFFGQAGDRVEY